MRIDFSAADIRHAEDVWYVLLRVSGILHRFWLGEPPDPDGGYAVVLPLDDRFPAASHAADQLWRSLKDRPVDAAPRDLTHQRLRRLTQCLRALDAHHDGSSYRAIAEALFGPKRLPDHAWKTHDLRSRTIRLVKTGIDLMQSGFRKLLDPKR